MVENFGSNLHAIRDEISKIKSDADEKLLRLKILDNEMNAQEKNIRNVADSISDKAGNLIHND